MRTFLTNRIYCLLLAGGLIASVTGCQTYGPTNLTPAKDVLNASCCQPDTETEINFLALRQTPPEQYVLDKGDILGIYIQGITGDKDVPPPVNFPNSRDEDVDPGLGYPVPVRDDGYISLPLVTPIRVTGLTLSQAERKIVGAYTKDKKILLEGNEKIIVTLMKRRTYNVLVIREDGSSGNSNNNLRRNEVFVDDDLKSESFSIELPAYENDVLHALSETGGLPGERALNEIVVLRGGQNTNANGSVIQAVGAPNFGGTAATIDGANAIRIPIKAEAGQFPNISEQDITLNDGDIVYIKGRERDVFYTGGLLAGGRFPLPRDYDIDVLEAVAIAGGSASAASGQGSLRTGEVKPATQITILRKCGCEQVAIDVDLRYALADPTERVIIQPGDLIVLEYRKNELFINTVAQVFTFGGIFNVFR